MSPKNLSLKNAHRFSLNHLDHQSSSDKTNHVHARAAEKMVEKLGSDMETAKEATKNLRIKYAWTILNKIGSPEMESIMKEKLKERGIEPIGSIRYDPDISKSILEGIPLEDGEAKEDVENVVNRLEDLVTRQSTNVNSP